MPPAPRGRNRGALRSPGTAANGQHRVAACTGWCDPGITRPNIPSRNRAVFPQYGFGGVSSEIRHLLLIALDQEIRGGAEPPGQEGNGEPLAEGRRQPTLAFKEIKGNGLILPGGTAQGPRGWKSNAKLKDSAAPRAGLCKLDMKKFRLESSRFLISHSALNVCEKEKGWRLFRPAADVQRKKRGAPGALSAVRGENGLWQRSPTRAPGRGRNPGPPTSRR